MFTYLKDQVYCKLHNVKEKWLVSRLNMTVMFNRDRDSSNKKREIAVSPLTAASIDHYAVTLTVAVAILTYMFNLQLSAISSHVFPVFCQRSFS